MLQPSGTPEEGDVPIYRAGQRRTEWGSISADFQAQIDDLQAQINALGGGGGIADPGGLTPLYANIGGYYNRFGLITVNVPPNVFTVVNNAGNPTTGNPADIMVNGYYSGEEPYFLANASPAGLWIKFVFNSPVLITEARIYHNLTDIQNLGTWIWEGSNDGLNWTSIGSSFPFDLATYGNINDSGSGPGNGSVYMPFTTLSGNTLLWRVYRVRCVSSSAWGGRTASLREFAFKIAGLD